MRAQMRVGQLAEAGRADETDDVLLLHREARIAVKRGEQIGGPASAGDGRIGYGSHGNPGPAVHHRTSGRASAAAKDSCATLRSADIRNSCHSCTASS